MENEKIFYLDELADGAYAFLETEDDFIPYAEAVRYVQSDFNRIYNQKVRLPDGKSNIIYLLSSSFERSIKMANGENFFVPPTYRRFYFPFIYIGKFLGRRYRVSTMNVKDQKFKTLRRETKLRPIVSRYLTKTPDNVFFDMSDIYLALQKILVKTTIKMNYEYLFPDILKIMKDLTPEPVEVNDKKGSGKRILIIDADSFAFDIGASLKENKTNPLFLLYLAFLRLRTLTKLNIDMEMLICSSNIFLKFNPKNLTEKELPVFRRALFRIMKTNLDDYTDSLSVDEKEEINPIEKNTVSGAVQTAIKPYVQMVSEPTKMALTTAIEKSLRKRVETVRALDKEIKKSQENIPSESEDKEAYPMMKKVLGDSDSLIHTNPVVSPLSPSREKLFDAIGNGQYNPLLQKTNLMIDDSDDENDDNEAESDELESIKDDATEILTDDEEVALEVLNDIQDRTISLSNQKTSPISSARDKKLRDAQKKIVVKTETIEEILSRDTSSVPVEEDDKSKVLHTTNPNMKRVRYGNFNKTYLEKLYTKDLIACFDQLKDKEHPFYVTDINIKDSSNSLNLKETWSVSLVDEVGKRSTIKIDLPKFQNERFMWLEGTRWLILPQDFYNPLVKDTPDTVILTTNYNKITITRKATRSLGVVERIFSLMKKTGDTKMFVSGDSSAGNLKYISSLEYDEISRRIFKFKTKTCEIYFSRDYLNENYQANIPADIRGDEFIIGMENGSAILINEDTGRDRQGRTISDIIEQNLPEEDRNIFNSIKSTSQKMYSECKMAGQWVPVIVPLLVWNGLHKTLDTMGINWNFDPTAKHTPQDTSSKKYIRFADGVLSYEAKVYAELIMNGLKDLHPEKRNFDEFESEECYSDFIHANWGSYRGIIEVKTFKDFLVDPITLDVCKKLMLPTTPDGLLIHAIKLLSDNGYTSKAYDGNYRIRTLEIISAILYLYIANQYKKYLSRGLPMTLNQNCVLSHLIKEKTVEAYSTLNPPTEVTKTHTISKKGFKGSNSEHSYDEQKRSYDPSAIGKVAMSTSPRLFYWGTKTF